MHIYFAIRKNVGIKSLGFRDLGNSVTKSKPPLALPKCLMSSIINLHRSSFSRWGTLVNAEKDLSNKICQKFPMPLLIIGKGVHKSLIWNFKMCLEVLSSQAEPLWVERMGRQSKNLPVLVLRFCWLVPLVQLSLPRFFFLLILHYRASAMVPISWNRLQKSPLTFDKPATKFGLPD